MSCLELTGRTGDAVYLDILEPTHSVVEFCEDGRSASCPHT